MNFYYNGFWRMDWGLGNPNKTAALIVILMVAVWGFPLLRKRGFWPALLIFTVLSGCLVQTYSRGGMVALLAGMAILLVWTPRPWPRTRLIAVVASLWIVGALVLYAKAETRYERGLFTEDQSITSRLVIWKHFPEMLASAPWGWGWGKAGDSYTQWFQPTNQSVNYLNLVNSHFTWMVEGGWAVSAFYLLGWLTVLLLCWPLPQSKLKAIPLAAWATFGVAGCFSHVAESIWVWIVPLMLLGYTIYERLKLQQWPKLKNVGLCATASAVAVATLVAIGSTGSLLPIKAKGGAVIVGRGSSATLIFVDRTVMGKLYGHTFRRFLTENPDRLRANTFILTESTEYAAPTKIQELVVCGGFTEDKGITSDFGRSDQIVLMNPGYFPEETKLDNGVASKILVYFGEYSQAPSRSSWSNYPGIKALLLDGASDFVPSWPQAVLNPPRT